jgi:hypothetical protein
LRAGGGRVGITGIGSYIDNMKVKRYTLAALMVFCILAGGLLAYSYKLFLSTGTREGPESMPRFLPKLAKVRTHLYFLGPNHRFLKAEERTVVQQDVVVERARGIVYALIEGPEGDEYLPTVPPETRLLALYVTEDGIAYVDFDKAISGKHPGGSLSELFTIFSIVNTLALNIPEIEAVKILIEGREAETLAGHIDIRFPFWPNILMIK